LLEAGELFMITKQIKPDVMAILAFASSFSISRMLTAERHQQNGCADRQERIRRQIAKAEERRQKKRVRRLERINEEHSF
jgi:hypothetical protein